MINETNCPIYRRKDGSYIVRFNGGFYGINVGDEDCLFPYSEIEAYLIDHPEALQPEPLPPAPSDEQLKAAAEAQRQALFREYDTAIAMLTRAERLGDTTASAKIAAWDAYAVALQEINDEPEWFRSPAWPTKPEA